MQNIRIRPAEERDIPAMLADLSDRLSRIPKWKDICKEREEAAKRLMGK